MFGGVSLPKAISARRGGGKVVPCSFNIRPPHVPALTPNRRGDKAFKTFQRNASFRFADSFPHLAIGSFTRSLSDSEAVRQLPDRIARFPAPHCMPLVPVALQFP
jgi:hypothetical protein